MTSRSAPRPARRLAFAVLVLAMLLLHALLADRMAGWLQAAAQAAQQPQRLQLRLVRELQPVEPEPLVAAAPTALPAAARAAAAPAQRASAPAAKAASAPARAEPPKEATAPPSSPPAAAGEPEPELAAAASAPAQPVASEPAQPTAAAAPAPAVAASGPSFEWPRSTRLSYSLVGWVRGEVHGSAQAEWLREGERYQMHLDVLLGPSFAPIVQRRMSSDGRITPQGLAPRRYDESTQAAFGRPRQVQLAFDDDGVTLANGQRVATLPALQDTASQFMQLIYLFSTDPSRLREGASIEVPLALARRVDRWYYDVAGRETLDTPVGRVPAWHLLPRRAGDASALSIETWFAPGLQYLPVRIVIRQGPEDYIDLLIERLPLQADDGAASAPR